MWGVLRNVATAGLNNVNELTAQGIASATQLLDNLDAAADDDDENYDNDEDENKDETHGEDKSIEGSVEASSIANTVISHEPILEDNLKSTGIPLVEEDATSDQDEVLQWREKIEKKDFIINQQMMDIIALQETVKLLRQEYTEIRNENIANHNLLRKNELQSEEIITTLQNEINCVLKNNEETLRSKEEILAKNNTLILNIESLTEQFIEKKNEIEKEKKLKNDFFSQLQKNSLSMNELEQQNQEMIYAYEKETTEKNTLKIQNDSLIIELSNLKINLNQTIEKLHLKSTESIELLANHKNIEENMNQLKNQNKELENEKKIYKMK